MLQLTGRIIEISEVMQITESFKKCELVIKTDEQYPQEIKFDLVNKNVELRNALQVGQDVIVSFNLRGSSYQGKRYVNLQAWRIDLVSVQRATPNTNQQYSHNQFQPIHQVQMPEPIDMSTIQPKTVVQDQNSTDDDLPF